MNTQDKDALMDDYEMFIDPAYYDMWAVRKIGNRNFNDAIHLLNEKEALHLIEFLRQEKKQWQSSTIESDVDVWNDFFNTWSEVYHDSPTTTREEALKSITQKFTITYKAANKEQGSYELTVEDYKEVIEDNKRLVRELDVLLNGENAAKQASLCDIISQLKTTNKEQSFTLKDVEDAFDGGIAYIESSKIAPNKEQYFYLHCGIEMPK